MSKQDKEQIREKIRTILLDSFFEVRNFPSNQPVNLVAGADKIIDSILSLLQPATEPKEGQTIPDLVREQVIEALAIHIPAVNRGLLACDELAKILITIIERGLREQELVLKGYDPLGWLAQWASENGYVKMADEEKEVINGNAADLEAAYKDYWSLEEQSRREKK